MTAEVNDTKLPDIVAVWNLLGRLGLVDGAFNHISYCRYRSGSAFLDINPAQGGPGNQSAADFKNIEMKVYNDDDAKTFGVNPDALRLHTHIHLVRGRPGCAIHLHSPHSVAVSATEVGLMPLSQTAIEFADRLALIEYRGLAREGFDDPSLAQIAREGGEALLRNHGLLVVADDAIQAFYAAYYLEEACRLQILTLSQGLQLHRPAVAVVTATAEQLRSDRPAAARATFDALSARFGLSA
jgi:ribulose-5-phosphate 4-epimerase/fuculose-1-phosphate aldolase